ncbi:hypothetical protein J6Y73_00310 [bacterium]|nr:hypothetical protein [bacterium]
MGIFKKEAETTIKNSNPRLRTRFYRNSLKEVKDAFQKICIEENKSLRQADEYEGKMYISTQTYEIFIKISSEVVSESSVDLSVRFFQASLKNPKKIIYSLYKKLDKILVFKGTLQTK